ncbi:MAG: hypothetical protein H7Z43_07425, partial [Clostridia bacterium]|nr:hypothetical protein [Deltaproteobacteria bacterium]
MIGFWLLVLAAKAPAPPQVYCEDNHAILHLPYADIAVGANDTQLRDAKPLPKAVRAESVTSKTLDVRGDASVLQIRPEGWTLVKGETQTLLTPPKTALGAEVRLYGVKGNNAWVAGQYWLARVDMTTGEAAAGKLLRDGRTAFVLDVGDNLLFAVSDRISKCSPDAVCAEVGRLPWSITRVSIGQLAFLFSNDSISDRVARVSRDKLETSINIETGSNAIACQTSGGVAVYLPASPWSVTRVPADPPG